MNHWPRISVVIPTYNRAHLISRAITSVLNQTRSADEIIVVDDGSKDNTQEVVARFGNQVRYIFQENAGAAVARHTGFMTAKSEWVALLDSDDVWNPDHLEHISEAILATSGCANYYFADMRRDQRAEYKTQWQLAKFAIDEPYVLFDRGLDSLLQGKRPTMLQATVFKKSAYLAVGGFMKTLRVHEDSHMCIKLGLKDPICAVSGGGTIMLDDDQAENRLSIAYKADKQSQIMRVSMYKDLLDYFGDRLTSEERKDITYRISRSYLAIAKASWRENAYIESLSNVTLSIVSSPRPLLKMIQRRLHG